MTSCLITTVRGSPGSAGASPAHSSAATLSKVAAAAASPFIVTVHPPVPEHAELHPENRESVAGVAVNATAVPDRNFALQVVGQSIPSGLDLIEPVPAPAFETVSVNDCGAVLANVA